MTSVCDVMLSSDEEEVSDDVQETNSKSNDGEGSSENEDSSSEDDAEEFERLAELRQSVTTVEETAATKSFSELGLRSWLVQQLNTMCIVKPTPVQASCIPKVLQGFDVLGCAKTGTGKTLAFVLPILNELAVDPYGIYALVLTPTRELASQIFDQFVALGKPVATKTSLITGGRSLVDQANELTARPHIVVATPGRLADHIDSDPEGLGQLFKKIQFFVLDEADQMLDGQYNEQLKTIFLSIPKQRRTLLFSATITSAITKLHTVTKKKPYFFEDKHDVATVDKLEQKFVLCPVAVKDAYLVGSLHSQIEQRLRNAALSSFRSKTLRILICTDVASRGLDIPHVDLVVNHNVPKSPKTYVHRVGRSARAGRYGAALTFVTQYDIVLLQAVEELIGMKLEELKVSDHKVTRYVTKVLVAKREAELRLEQNNFGERKEANLRKDLLMSGVPEEEVDKRIEEIKHPRNNMKRAHRKGNIGKKRPKIMRKEKLAPEKRKRI
ncbi:hypothetical protein V3C99_011218 [Haemonchus contortus]